jgi:dihydroorotate dehydrogenase electron transfer subunit
MRALWGPGRFAIVPLPMPVDTDARIIAHDALNADHFLLTLEAPRIARAARPGQFVMLQVHGGLDPLLRRPMSVCRIPDRGRRRIEVLYKVVGRGTRLLSAQRPGTRLMTLGPLGNGFRIPPVARSRRAAPPVVMVAGGIGIAVFPFLVDALRRRGRRAILVWGARTARDLVELDAFGVRGLEVRVATEDGSRGTRGLVTRVLEPLLAGAGPRPDLFACGPTPMLRAVGGMAVAAGAPCQLALESQMPCGIGVCLGCVVPCTGDAAGPVFRRVCTEGPVFRAGEVVL